MSKKIKVIVAGSRDFSNYDLLEDQLIYILSEIVLQEGEDVEFEIVSGGARGADKLGEKFAKNMEIPLKIFKANWDEDGKSAGMIRNKEMAKYASGFDMGVLVAFWDGESRGTEQMISVAEKSNLNTYIINYLDW